MYQAIQMTALLGQHNDGGSCILHCARVPLIKKRDRVRTGRQRGSMVQGPGPALGFISRLHSQIQLAV